ncbi:MAG: hypothetical protein ABEI97_00165 [Candidatus Nanohaloarchaea archaeon]
MAKDAHEEPFKDTVIDEERERHIITDLIKQNEEGLNRLAEEEADPDAGIFHRVKYWYSNKKSEAPKIGTVLV